MIKEGWFDLDDDETREDGYIVRRKSKFPKYNLKTNVPHFSLGVFFRSKIIMGQ